jgi:hypothetical protein
MKDVLQRITQCRCETLDECGQRLHKHLSR